MSLYYYYLLILARPDTFKAGWMSCVYTYLSIGDKQIVFKHLQSYLFLIWLHCQESIDESASLIKPQSWHCSLGMAFFPPISLIAEIAGTRRQWNSSESTLSFSFCPSSIGGRTVCWQRSLLLGAWIPHHNVLQYGHIDFILTMDRSIWL